MPPAEPEPAAAAPEPPAQLEAEPATEPPSSASEPVTEPATEPAPEPSEYGARARVELKPPTELHLSPRETRDLPGAFGDPFRVIDAMPGVVPALSGVPYVYVRGAPPAGTTYYYDGIQVPLLFHLALGPAVVHPAMIGAIDFYPSVAPARYGRYTGGVLAGGFSDHLPASTAHGEAELRLIDVNGMVEVPVGEGSITVAGRYGYPGLVLSLLNPNADLAYWDYQTRVDLPAGPHDRFQLTWFGSYDRVGDRNAGASSGAIMLEFHRAEARLIHKIDHVELGSALALGYERSAIQNGLQASSARIGPRMYLEWHNDTGVRVRTGADFMGIAGKLRAPADQDQAAFGITTPLYEDVAARSVSGAYAELRAPLHPRLILDAGLRGDLWLTGSRSEVAADPRAMLTLHTHDFIAWHVAAGLAHQPAVFLIPLPGIADVGLEHGLQSAVQSEAGVAIDLPAELRLESQVYVQRFANMIFPDLALDQMDDCQNIPAEIANLTTRCNQGYPRASAWAYGVEALLRRKVSESLSGWVSYTLGWARAHSEDGFDFRPSFDVRHVANLVLQYRIDEHWSAGLRLHYRSGKSASHTFLRAEPIRYEQRLPGFFRTDLQLSYAWNPAWGRLRVALEWLNVTLSREATDIECHDGVGVGANPLTATPCTVTYAPALFFPNLGIRAEL
ncbi:MAG TPA: TonB-dependent receptor [Polyangiales bacterium]|nr:TonB-dependent receptor [Polyangiales bacterium]